MRVILGMVACTLLAAGSPQSAPVAVIVSSGSTNSPAFRIVVQRSGDAEYTTKSAKPIHRKIEDAVVQRLYSDLDAAKPLGALPAEHCMKSASFGATLIIEFGTEQTPDLSCGGAKNSPAQDLKRDANEIVKAFRTN